MKLKSLLAFIAGSTVFIASVTNGSEVWTMNAGSARYEISKQTGEVTTVYRGRTCLSTSCTDLYSMETESDIQKGSAQEDRDRNYIRP